MTLGRVNALYAQWRSAGREARADLVQAMREAASQGFTLEQIGQAAGISKQRVSQLLNKP